MNVKGLEKCNKAKWKKVLKCTCKKIDGVNVDLDKCKFCSYTEREESIPKNNFKAFTKRENDIAIEEEVNEITLVFGKDDDVVGWTF